MENDKEKFKVKFKRRLYVFALSIVKCIDTLPRGTVSDVLGKQLLRSGTSVLANYIEAQAASSKKDFRNFFSYSLKSANESKVWIVLLKDSGKIGTEKADMLLKECIEISNILAKSVITMKENEKKK
ncbi:MAG: four helix bundle protein [Candidatus Moraniibacteriota bacterium]